MQLFILQEFIAPYSPFSSRPENDTSSCHDRDEKLQSLPSGHPPICGGSRSSVSDLCISPSCKHILWMLLLTVAVFLDWGRCWGPSWCVVDCLFFLNAALELALCFADPGAGCKTLGHTVGFWLKPNEWLQKVMCGQQRPMVSLASLHVASCGSAKDHTQRFQCVLLFHSAMSSA